MQGDVAAWFGSVPVVPAACTANELLGAEGCKTNGFENFDKISFWKTPTTKCADGSDGCVPYSEWVTTTSRSWAGTDESWCVLRGERFSHESHNTHHASRTT